MFVKVRVQSFILPKMMPDLNPHENRMSLLKSTIRKMNPAIFQGIEHIVKLECEKIPAEKCKRL